MTCDPPARSAPVVLVGSASAALREPLREALGRPLAAVDLGRHPDGELRVALRDPVRGEAVFVVQSTAAPVGEALLELLLLADACRRGGAAQVVAVLPYLGFARQDRRGAEGEALGLAVVARLMAPTLLDRVVVLDPHAPGVEGWFAGPVDTISAVPALAEALAPVLPPRPVIVAPDLGAARIARVYAQRLGAPLAVVHKVRHGAETAVADVCGEVAGRHPVFVDDLVSTGDTIAAALTAVCARGALTPAVVAATHLLPTAGAAARLAGLPLARVVVTDSLSPLPTRWPALAEVGVAPLLAEAIGRVHHGASLQALMVAR